MSGQESASVIIPQDNVFWSENFPMEYKTYAPSINQSILEQLELSAEPVKRNTFFAAARAYAKAVATYHEARKHKQQEQQALTDAIAALCEAYAALPGVEQQEVGDEDTIGIPTIAASVMCAAVFIGFTLAAIALSPALVLALPILMYGYGWSAIESIAGIIGIYHSKERSSTHNKIWDGLQYFSAAQLLVTTGLSLLHTLSEFAPHALNAFSASIFGRFGSVGFAAGALISAGQQLYVAYRAWRKSRDPRYFAEERREAITAELEFWHKKEKPPTMDELVKINQKIMVLTKQAAALDYYADCKEKGSLQLEGKTSEQRQQIYLSEFLIEKEKEKMKEHGINGLIWGAATAVMTAAIFGTPLGVVVAGFLVGMIGGAQIVQSIVSADYNKRAIEKAGGDKNALLEAAIKKTLTKTRESHVEIDKDITAIKGSLSEKHQRELIDKEAKRKYGYTDYFADKASEAKTAVSKKVSTAAAKASTAFCSFFSEMSPSRNGLNIQHDAEMNAHMGVSTLGLS